MQKIVLFLALIASVSLGYTANAQQQQGVNYQAVISNGSGQPVASQNVSVRFTVHRVTATGTTVYSETQSVMTNAAGLINTVIGIGTPSTGTWEDVAWNRGPFYLEVEADPAGGSTYASLGTTQLQAVPFAKQSEGITMFSSGTQNPNKMVISHSPNYSDWGVRYYDTGDVFQFVNGSDTVMEVNLGGNNVTVHNTLNVNGEIRTPATGNAHMLPIAYGTINASGTIQSGTGNFTVTKASTGRYEIAINNENYYYADYTTNVTLISSAGMTATTSASSELVVYTYNTSGTQADRIFQFVVYKN